jgi:MtN3 and saliva related transmembrane protein
MQLSDLVGYLAAALTTLSFLPQAIHTFKTKDVTGISLGMYSAFTGGVALWLVYGVLQAAWPIVIANVVTLSLAVAILVMKLMYRTPVKAAYLYGNIDIEDPALYEQYRAQVPAIIAAHGGRYLVRGGAMEVLEGNDKVSRQVIVAFADMASLKAFYYSPEYTSAKAIRQKAATGTLVAIEGMLP